MRVSPERWWEYAERDLDTARVLLRAERWDAASFHAQQAVEKVKVHRFRHTFATWAIENEARELDVQYLLGHSTPAMVRRYSATYDAEKAARAHERFSPADRMGERMR